MTPSCRIAFRLLAHVSQLQQSRSLNVLAFRRILAHFSTRYPCISSSQTQWVKNNNKPNYSHELKRVLAWPSSPYLNYPLSFFVFMGNLVDHDVLASSIYFYFIYTLFFFYKSQRYMYFYNVRKFSSFRQRVQSSLAWISWDGILYSTSILHKFD